MLVRSVAGLGYVRNGPQDGTQAFGDGSCRGHPSDQLLVDGKALEPAVQPLRSFRVSVAVRQERPILENRRLSHGRLSIALPDTDTLAHGNHERFLPNVQEFGHTRNDSK